MQDDTQTPSNTQSAQVPQAPITQPVVQAVPTSQPTAPVIPPVTQVTAPQKRVLVVEDDGFLREIYLESLSRTPYKIESAIDGEDAFTKITQGGWDLVLLDIVMPKMDGLDVVRKIKSDVTVKDKKLYNKLIFLTNLDNDVDMKEATKLGNGYIAKSAITPGELQQKVAELLQ